MKEILDIDQPSSQVVKAILLLNPCIETVEVLAHEVSTNWRQKHTSVNEKMSYFFDGFYHSKPIAEKSIHRDIFLKSSSIELEFLGEHVVWSISSSVICQDGRMMHIPMMNFHPEIPDCQESIRYILQAIHYIDGHENGVLLESGRYYHYYGKTLLSEKDWYQFLGEFLMPTILVSPRYIGHSLDQDKCTLRLTADSKYKPVIPRVIAFT